MTAGVRRRRGGAGFKEAAHLLVKQESPKSGSAKPWQVQVQPASVHSQEEPSATAAVLQVPSELHTLDVHASPTHAHTHSFLVEL